MAQSNSASPSRLRTECTTVTSLALLPDAIPPESVLYFHGKITREQAEQMLIAHRATEGLFLLRESVNGNYVISICHMNRVHHYNVERQPDAYYKIQTGRRFVGPVELVKHHSEHLDGFLTLARTPLNMAEGCSPLVLQGVPLDELEQKLRLKAVEMGLKGQSVTEALSGPMREHLRHLVFKELHVCQPWYHHTIRRREAEHRLAEDGNYEGSFLLRFRREDATFVLSLCSQAAPKHYKIEEHLGRWSIEGGQYFETLIEMIDHYHHRQDGLLCKLRRPVVAPSFTRSRSGSSTGTAFINANTKKEDCAVQTCTSTAELGAWNGSHSLPSLCQVPLVTTSICSNPIVPRLSKTDAVQPKQDLISFADWPNVTKLLAEQAANDPSTRFNASSGSSTQPLIPLTPETPVPNPLAQITPTPSNTFMFTNQSPFAITTTTSTICPSGPPQNIFSTTSSSTTAVRQDSAFDKLWSPTHKRCGVTEQNRLRPTQPSGDVEGAKSFVDMDALIPTASNAVCHSAEWLKAITVTSSSSNNNSTGTVFPTAAHQNGSDRGRAVFNFTASSEPSKFDTFVSGTNNTSQTASLHFGPILDTPWEEPECSEEHSTPSSDGSVFVAGEALITPNTFLNSSPGAIPTNPFLPNPFNPQTQLFEQPRAANSPKMPPRVTLAHSPDVSTFCSASCCTHTCRETPQLSKIPQDPGSPNGKHPLCQRKMQLIYDELPLSHSLLSIENITLKERLGGGNFGYVVKGSYRTPSGQEVPVAVKTLKPNQITNAGEREILAEARTMAQLKHRHIVRLIGVCKEEKFMLVLELAPLGPINKYLKKRPDVPVHTLTELMHQVAMGMAYLESCKFVHRDLAARNVLLVTTHFAKISDFGMSKALNFGSDYYRAASAGKWPLKWYAPECIYYFRFDSKSDVWSYGITLWEVYSYGERPYRDMKGAQILAMLDQGLRLSRPSRCPESIYSLMQQCWNFEGVRRPTFAELVLALSRILRVMPQPASSCEIENQSTVPTSSMDGTDSHMYSQSKRTNCSGSGGSGVNSGASDGPSF